MKLSRLARILFSIGVLAATTTGCVKGVLGAGSSTSSTFGDSSSGGGASSSGDGGATEADDPGPPAKPGTMDASAPQPVQDLWKAFVAAHDGATTANAVATGKKIWPLLGPDAHANIGIRLGQILEGFRSNKLGVDLESLTYRVIGEIAAERANRIIGADIEVRMRTRDDGSVTAEIEGHYRGDRIPSFEAREERGTWSLIPSGGLFASARASSHGGEEVKHPASLEALATEWTRVLEHGRGREAYELLSSGTHNQLLSGANEDGLDQFAVVSVLDAALDARQGRKLAITGHTIDRKRITLTYADGTSETFAADEFADEWFIDLM